MKKLLTFTLLTCFLACGNAVYSNLGSLANTARSDAKRTKRMSEQGFFDKHIEYQQDFKFNLDKDKHAEYKVITDDYYNCLREKYLYKQDNNQKQDKYDLEVLKCRYDYNTSFFNLLNEDELRELQSKMVVYSDEWVNEMKFQLRID